MTVNRYIPVRPDEPTDGKQADEEDSLKKI